MVMATTMVTMMVTSHGTRAACEGSATRWAARSTARSSSSTRRTTSRASRATPDPSRWDLGVTCRVRISSVNHERVTARRRILRALRLRSARRRRLARARRAQRALAAGARARGRAAGPSRGVTWRDVARLRRAIIPLLPSPRRSSCCDEAVVVTAVSSVGRALQRPVNALEERSRRERDAWVRSRAAGAAHAEAAKLKLPADKRW